MINETLHVGHRSAAAIRQTSRHGEDAVVHGRFEVQCHDADGRLKWADHADNLVTTLGKNILLDTLLAGSSYSVTGPYMGLINTNASAAAAGDTMASHAGWLEVGATNDPDYSGTRKTIAFNAASSGSKAATAAASFSMTNSGTVGGCFLVLGTGATNTIDNTGGTLYSAGAFSGGSKTVANGDTLSVTYTASIT